MPYFAFCFWFFKPDHQSKLCPMPHSLHHPSLFILSHLFNWVSRTKRAKDTVVTGADFNASILIQTKILLWPDNKVKHNTARLKQTAKRLIRCGRSNNEYRSQFSERDFFPVCRKSLGRWELSITFVQVQLATPIWEVFSMGDLSLFCMARQPGAHRISQTQCIV